MLDLMLSFWRHWQKHQGSIPGEQLGLTFEQYARPSVEFWNKYFNLITLFHPILSGYFPNLVEQVEVVPAQLGNNAGVIGVAVGPPGRTKPLGHLKVLNRIDRRRS